MHRLNHTDEITLRILQMENRELTAQEIAEKAGESLERVQKSLEKIFKYCAQLTF